jgi:hypothetical protein
VRTCFKFLSMYSAPGGGLLLSVSKALLVFNEMYRNRRLQCQFNGQAATAAANRANQKQLNSQNVKRRLRSPRC